MNYKFLTLILGLTIFGCKSNESEKTVDNKISEVETLTIAEKIAKAHGYDNWDDVTRVEFTFKVDRNNQSGSGRHWSWEPKSNNVIFTVQEDSIISYNRHKVDSSRIDLDRAFINDKFWLLVPFQLVWDDGITISEPITAIAPLSKEELNKITLLYSNEGGYTPGDAYDIYYDNDFMIREWVFRQGNSEKASLTNTFEDYKDFNGIKIATEHKKDNGNWNLRLDDINVITK